MRILLLLISLALIFSGCTTKEPLVKEVYMPIKCEVEIPYKPELDGSFESHKAKMLYLLKCERLLYHCVGEKYE